MVSVMIKSLLGSLFCLILFSASSQTAWRQKESEVRVLLNHQDDARKLSNLRLNGDIHASAGFALMYVTPAELEEIQSVGLMTEVTKPDLNHYFKDFWKTRDAYHSYEEIISLMDSLVGAFPTICQKITYDTTLQGRAISCLKISRNVSLSENEPEVLFDAGIHGDEIGGPENLIRFAQYLCTGYGSDPEITKAIDTREIIIYPMVNPDGRANMSRYNSNGIDCNRDGGYMWNGEGNSPSACSQIETRALRNCMYNHHFVIHVTYHSGIQEVIYPWCYRATHAPDYAALNQLAGIYSSASGYTALPYLQSYADYPTNGETIDYSYGVSGTDALTMEISNNKQPPASQIQYYFDVNLPSMMAMIKNAGYGIEGMITDSLTGAPVPAVIFINDFFPVSTDIAVGDYHKYLPAGTYTMKVMANHYLPKAISQVIIVNRDSTVLNIRLTPDPGQYAAKIAAVVIPGNNPQDVAFTPRIIGAPDSSYYSLGKNGWIIVDMQDTLRDIPGDDFKVYEGDDTPEGFSCFAGQTIDGPWISVGNGTGTFSFDLSGTGLTSARFIKLKDDNDGLPNTNHAGFDLDAIEGFFLNTSVPGPDVPNGLVVRLFPNPVVDELTVTTGNTSFTGLLTIYAANGKLLFSEPIHNGTAKVGTPSLADGIYILKLSNDRTFWTGKFRKDKR